MLMFDKADEIGSALDLAPVSPSDTVDTAEPFRALWIGSEGSVSYISARGVIRTIPAVPAGWFLVAGSRVRATGTTATNIFSVPCG